MKEVCNGDCAHCDFLNFLYNNIPGGVVQFTVEECPKIVNANREFLKLFGYSEEVISSSECSHICDLFAKQESKDQFKDWILNTPCGGSASFEFQIIRRDGQRCWINLNALIIVCANGAKACQAIAMDITEEKLRQEEAERILKEQAEHDLLTGLYNRTAAHQRADQMLEENEPGTPCAVAVISIDSLDLIHTTYGYAFGDAVLVNIADCLKQVFEDHGVIGRLSSDRFFVYLNKMSHRTVEEKIKELTQKLRNVYAGENRKIKVLFSIGIDEELSGNAKFDTMCLHAESILDLARERGENQTVFSGVVGGLKAREILSPTGEKQREAVMDGGNMTVRYDIKNFAYDILERTPDSNSAINILLQHIGTRLDLDLVSVVEVESAKQWEKVIYQWTAEGYSSDVGRVFRHSKEDFDFICKIADQSGIYEMRQDDLYIPEFLVNRMSEIGLKSHMCGIIMEEGMIRAGIVFEDCKELRNWTDEEKAMLLEFTRSVSSTVIKMVTLDAANQRHDQLTGLPMLPEFIREVEQTHLEVPEKQNHKLAYVSTDFKNFKYINLDYGYGRGDEILKDFAARIKASPVIRVGPARVSADIFVSVIDLDESGMTEEQIKAHVLSVNKGFCQSLAGSLSRSSLVIKSGIYFTDGTEDPALALDRAVIARKSLVNAYECETAVFDNDMQNMIEFTKEIEDSMMDALDQEEFFICLQPQINLENRKIIGAEALVRWLRPNGQVMIPSMFIPLFERNGFIVKLDFYVLEKVLQYLHGRMTGGKRVVPVSVNLSGLHSKNLSLADDIIELVNSYEVPAELIEFELTETVFVNNVKFFDTTVKRLREFGFRISMDDFGTGYSSLSLLTELPADILKIDKGLLDESIVFERKTKLIRHVVEMAKDIGFDVICEGVETQEEADFLHSIGCNKAQGFYFARPMTVSDFDELVGML